MQSQEIGMIIAPMTPVTQMSPAHKVLFNIEFAAKLRP